MRGACSRQPSRSETRGPGTTAQITRTGAGPSCLQIAGDPPFAGLRPRLAVPASSPTSWLASFAVSDNSQGFVNELVAMILRLSPDSVGPPTPDQGDHGRAIIGVWDIPRLRPWSPPSRLERPSLARAWPRRDFRCSAGCPRQSFATNKLSTSAYSNGQ